MPAPSFLLCEHFGVEVELLEEKEPDHAEIKLAKDVITIITVLNDFTFIAVVFQQPFKADLRSAEILAQIANEISFFLWGWINIDVSIETFVL